MPEVVEPTFNLRPALRCPPRRLPGSEWLAKVKLDRCHYTRRRGPLPFEDKLLTREDIVVRLRIRPASLPREKCRHRRSIQRNDSSLASLGFRFANLKFGLRKIDLLPERTTKFGTSQPGVAIDHNRRIKAGLVALTAGFQQPSCFLRPKCPTDFFVLGQHMHVFLYGAPELVPLQNQTKCRDFHVDRAVGCAFLLTLSLVNGDVPGRYFS